MAGDYVILGRKPDSSATYTGHLSLHTRGTRLIFTRTVAGRTDRGTATFVKEPFLEACVLQMTVRTYARCLEKCSQPRPGLETGV